MTNHDSTWKEALEHYLQPFLALFFPQIYDDIDWTRGHEWLDKELHKLTRKDEIGGRIVDVLVKVYRKNGQERWLLIHIEVQGSYEAAFPQRMFVYHYRIFNRYKRKLCSLAILADDRPSWRPKRYAHSVWGCRVTFTFPSVKLLDLLPRLPELEASDNPFAILVAAHLLAQQTRDDAVQRRVLRLRLYRGLYQRGFSREDIQELFHLLDAFMTLPQPEEDLFWDEIDRYEKEKNMPHMTSIERRGLERGLERGRAEGQVEMLLFVLENHFRTPLSEELAARIRQTSDANQFKTWLELTYSCGTLEEFQQRMGG